MKPVALPPGWARLSTMPAPTGSATAANTIGKVRLICCNAVTARVPLAKIVFGASATNSAAYFALRSALSSLQRVSIRTLRPTPQPDSCRPCWNAASRSCPSGLSAARFMSTPIRSRRSGCCAFTATGHAAVALPRRVMKSRRLMGPQPGPESTTLARRKLLCATQKLITEWQSWVGRVSLMRRRRSRHVRFCRLGVQTRPSGDVRCTTALPPKAEVHPRSCYVAFVPQGDICSAARNPVYSITSSARASSDGGTSRPSTLAVVKLMTRSNLVGCSTGMSAGFAPRKILST
jgi:hypothetical protein